MPSNILLPSQIAVPSAGKISIFINKDDGYYYYKTPDNRVVFMADGQNGIFNIYENFVITQIENLTGDELEILKTNSPSVTVKFSSVRQIVVAGSGGGGRGPQGKRGIPGSSADHWVATRIVSAPNSDPTYPFRATNSNIYSALSEVNALIAAGTIPGALIYLLEGTFDTALGNPDPDGTLFMNQQNVIITGADAGTIISNSKNKTLFNISQINCTIQNTAMVGSGNTAIEIISGADHATINLNNFNGFGTKDTSPSANDGLPVIDITDDPAVLTNDIIIEGNVFIANLTGGVGIRLAQVNNLSILTNTFISCTPGIKDSTAGAFNITNIRIVNNFFTRGDGTLGDGILLVQSNGVIVANNDFLDIDTAINFEPDFSFGIPFTNALINDNRINHFFTGAINFNGQGGVISSIKINNNVIILEDGGVTGVFAIALTFATGCIIQGNVINGYNPIIDIGTPVVGTAGILLQDCDHTIVIGNNVVNMPGPQILLRDSPDIIGIQSNRHLTISGNICTSVAANDIFGPQNGIEFRKNVNHIIVDGNEVATNNIGIFIGDPALDTVSQIIVSNNIASNSGVAGIQGGSPAGLIAKNTISNNNCCNSPIGIQRLAGSGNVWIVMGNYATNYHNGGVGFEVFLGNLDCDGSAAIETTP